MSKVFLLGAGTEYDTDKQAVAKNQIIRMNGYEDDRYVVYDIVSSKWGLSYELINLRTKTFGQCDLIRPLSQKFGIGYYFDDENPEFMDAFEVVILKGEAEQNRQAEQEAKQQQQERDERLKAIGRQRLEAIIPEAAKAVIIAERPERTRQRPLKKVGKKNGTKHCKNHDSPISPSDPQASTTISDG